MTYISSKHALSDVQNCCCLVCDSLLCERSWLLAFVVCYLCHAVFVTFAIHLWEEVVICLVCNDQFLSSAARAMLMKADIMLLDEPTNHLDVKNVAWLEHYLTHLPDVTSMVVSHDSGFLDNVCTGIIHYENRKLKHYVVSIISVSSLLYSLLASCAFSFL